MAIRNIRTMGDRILTKKCRTVDEITPKIRTLIFDMLDTMYDACGVGLAAPQVGILKRIVVIDVGEGPYVLINPVITETSGEQTGDEGCLSLPGKSGTVTRPNIVTVNAYNEHMGITVIMNNHTVSTGKQILFMVGCGCVAFLLTLIVSKRKHISR